MTSSRSVPRWSALLVLSLAACLFAIQCGRYGPPRRPRPTNVPQASAPSDPQQGEEEDQP